MNPISARTIVYKPSSFHHAPRLLNHNSFLYARYCRRSNKPLTLSTLLTASSNLSNLFLFSLSRCSRTSTLASNFALARLSCATISFACWNSCALSSSSSLDEAASCDSAVKRSVCSRAKAVARSVCGGLAKGAWEGGGVRGERRVEMRAVTPLLLIACVGGGGGVAGFAGANCRRLT